MTDVTPRRKRSASARLSAAGLAAMLSGCDNTPDYQKQFGTPTEVAAFQSVDECVASGSFTRADCVRASNTALQNDEKAAPRYESQTLCEDNFGGGECVRRNESGQSYFVPLLTGFMIGRMLDGGGYRYHGLYRDRRDDSYYTGSGAWLSSGGYGGRPWSYQVGSRAVSAPATPVTTQRIQTRSSVVSRGGFGGRASSRGGWGGFGG